jgi:hypothetical protein
MCIGWHEKGVFVLQNCVHTAAAWLSRPASRSTCCIWRDQWPRQVKQVLLPTGFLCGRALFGVICLGDVVLGAACVGWHGSGVFGSNKWAGWLGL